MNWENDDKNGQNPEDLEENYQDELNYSPWRTKKIISYIPELFNTKILLVCTGIGLLALFCVYFVMFVPKGNDANQIKSLEVRLQNAEDRLIELKRIDEKISWLVSLDRKIDRLSGRVAKLESSLTNKIPTVKSEVDVGRGVKRTVAKPAVQKTNSQYYQVKAGDTLYSISRRFGLSVDGLRRLNKLAPKASIYPGQQLSIKP